MNTPANLLLTVMLLCPALPLSAVEKIQPLFVFDPEFNVSSIAASDAKVTLTGADKILVRTGHRQAWPGITLRAPQGKWDLDRRARIEAAVTNRGKQAVTVFCRVDNPGADGRKNCITANVKLKPGETGTLTVRLCPTPWSLSKHIELIGMRASPGRPPTLDPGNVTQLLFFLNRPAQDHVFEIGTINATGRVATLDAETFFPFIDELGQFIHADWPGKLDAVEELESRRKAEDAELVRKPGPSDRNRYGGWTAGPQLEATGFFRVQKYRGKWWLIDPEGRLFWSHGVDCVRPSSSTPISDREHYYRHLPEQGSPLARFFGRGSWAPHGYYKTHTPYRTFDFGAANLRRKYGENWWQLAGELDHRRLRSWGLNTIANWSDSHIYRMRRTPYVCTISFSSKTIEGSQGYWGKFHDVFDPGFRAALRRRLQGEKGNSAGDPWCLGYFVHNELSWGDELSLAVAALASPPEQAAKIAFMADLRKKYGTIARLNESWNTTHASWETLLKNTTTPDRQRARDDLAAFYTRISETYFEIIRDELKKVAPEQLYMGCRFAWVNERAARAAAKYCDVISYNRYAYSVEDHRLPEGIDLPVIIGEFHFGALDRGMFHTGLRPTESQQARAATYRSYVTGALKNPLIIGTHWFQYRDQATTGRGDGENYQIGLVDICDTPYPETIDALRQVGYDLYETRLGKR